MAQDSQNAPQRRVEARLLVNKMPLAGMICGGHAPVAGNYAGHSPGLRPRELQPIVWIVGPY